MLRHTRLVSIVFFLSVLTFPRFSISRESAELPPLWEILLHVSDNEDVAAVVSMILEPNQFFEPQEENTVIGSQGAEDAHGEREMSDRPAGSSSVRFENREYGDVDKGSYHAEERSVQDGFNDRSQRKPKQFEGTFKRYEEMDDRPAWGETPLVDNEDSMLNRIRVNHEKTQNKGERRPEDTSNRKHEEFDDRPVWGETQLVKNEDFVENRIKVDIEKFQDRGEKRSKNTSNRNHEEIDDRPAWGETPLEVVTK